jgi:hypothetical protein
MAEWCTSGPVTGTVSAAICLKMEIFFVMEVMQILHQISELEDLLGMWKR